MAYELGESVRCRAELGDPENGNAPYDPPGMIFSVTDPAGAVTTYTLNTDPELVQHATGRYSVLVTVDQSGEWEYRFYWPDYFSKSRRFYVGGNDA